MKIIFIGGIDFNNNDFDQNNFNAAEKLQYKLILGLKSNKVYFINAPFKKNHINKDDIITKDNLTIYNIKTTNYKIINHYIKFLKIKRILKHISNDNENFICLIYSAYFPFMKNLKFISNKLKIKTVVYIPDLPIFMQMGESNLYKRITKFISNKIFYNNIKYIDGFIEISLKMNSLINLYDKPFIVIEGMCEPTNEAIVEKDTSSLFIFTYAGSMQLKYNIELLLEAFTSIKNNSIRLVLCGNGDAINLVNKYIEHDNRIIYKGLLTEIQLKEIYSQTDILVNPRLPENDFSKYSFPSKIIEYMIFGKPIICFKLDGIPDEYDDYLIYPESNDLNGLINSMKNSINLNREELLNIGIRNKTYVGQHKNYIAQTKRIEKFLIDEVMKK